MRILFLALILSAAAAPALAQQAPASAQALHLRYLTWPGKVAPARAQPARPAAPPAPGAPMQTASAVQPRDPAWSPAYRPVPHGSSHYLGQVTPAQAAAIDQQRAADRQKVEDAKALAEAEKAKAEAEQKQAQIRSAPLPPTGLPTSIYAAPAAAPAPQPAQADAGRMAMAGAYDQHARFYSLHRAYGERPDPVALSPQFLSTPSADLADPPPPPPPRILPGQTATPAQQTAARVQARDADSSD